MPWVLGLISLGLLLILIIFTPSLIVYDHTWIFGVLILLLSFFSFLCLKQLYALYKQHKHYVFGNKLAWRLVSMFAAVSIIPGGMVWLLSSQFLTRSIDSWFEIPIQKALDQGIELGRHALQNQEQQLRQQAKAWSEHQNMQQMTKNIPKETRQHVLISTPSEILWNQGFQSAPLPSAQSLWKDAAQYPSGIRIQQYPNGELWINVYHFFKQQQKHHLLFVSEPVPPALARPAKNIEETRTAYQKLVLSRVGLKHVYRLSLGLSFAVALSCALALALAFARRLVTPLAHLVAGTEAIAQGDFSKKQIIVRQDELGTLSTMFNRMTDQLDQAQANERAQRLHIESVKAYLETILSHLDHGVITLDQEGFIRVYNSSAEHILGTDFKLYGRTSFFDWAELGFLHEAWRQSPKALSVEHLGKTLMIQASELPEEAGGGYLLIINDISTLAQAQRHAAWGEVAKRLAHEIRNPLTPIQWATERLQIKLSGKLPEPEESLLIRSTETITKQVNALKDMVDAFRQYAKPPGLRLEYFDLNALIHELLFFYEQKHNIQFIPCKERTTIHADQNLMRQVIHNLVQNAQDAVQTQEHAQIIIKTSINHGMLSLEFQDNGHGFLPELLPKVFDPYITNKAKGTGLGLAIVKKIVEEHHGSIAASNVEPHGALLSIYLNLHHDASF